MRGAEAEREGQGLGQSQEGGASSQPRKAAGMPGSVGPGLGQPSDLL